MKDNQGEKDISLPEVHVDLNIKILPWNVYNFTESLSLASELSVEFVPKAEETEFSFPKSTEAARLMYKNLS